MGQGPTPFFNRRRVDGLLLGTPRHMPVPAKEMDVLLRSVYTFGGPSAPDMSRGTGGSNVRKTVRQIWEEFSAMQRAMSRNRN